MSKSIVEIEVTRVVVYYLPGGGEKPHQWAVRNGTQKPPRDFVLAYIGSPSYDDLAIDLWANDITPIEAGLPDMPDEILAAVNAAAWVNEALRCPDGADRIKRVRADRIVSAIEKDCSSTWPPVAGAVVNALNHHSVEVLEQHRELCSFLLSRSTKFAHRMSDATESMNHQQFIFWSEMAETYLV